MAGKSTFQTVREENGQRTVFFEQLDAAGTTSPAVRLQGAIVVQIAGTATTIEAIVEHATQDPGSGMEDWAPAERDKIIGNLSLGIPPREFAEPAIGWWRVRVPILTGGNARISIIGDKA